MLIKEALSILTQTNEKIQLLGVELVDPDLQDSPKLPRLQTQINQLVMRYTMLLQHILLNDDGDEITGTIGENDEDLNIILIQLQELADLNDLPGLPIPRVTYVLNSDGSGGGESVGLDNEVQTSDGDGGFVASKLFFDEETGNMVMGGAASTGTEREITVNGSELNIALKVKSKGTSPLFLKGQNLALNTLNVADWKGMVGGSFIEEATTRPNGSPLSGNFFYIDPTTKIPYWLAQGNTLRKVWSKPEVRKQIAEFVVSVDPEEFPDYFTDTGETVPYPALTTSAVHYTSAVNNGPINTIYYVEATVVVQDNAGNGGVIKIGGLFKKDASEVITQIGSTQTLLAAIENISGTLGASFIISGSPTLLNVQHSTLSANCYSSVSFNVVTCGRA